VDALEARVIRLRELSMSHENLDVVRRLYAAGGPFALPLGPEGERALLDHLFEEYYDEQLKVLMPPDYPEGEQVYVGRRGMSKLIGGLRDSWTKWRFQAERFIEAGEHVIVLIRVVAEGGASGIATERETAHLWTLRAGRLTSIQIYRDRAEALGAVGLGERHTGPAMSQDNVEVVRRFLLGEVEDALAYADPNIVWNPAEESAALGHDAVRESLHRWKGEWHDYELLPEEFEHMGDRVLATVRVRGRGRGSGVEVDARFYDVYTLRHGKIVRMDQFTDQSEALEAAGLR
jgi:ketosteroid isomerase-like protein